MLFGREARRTIGRVWLERLGRHLSDRDELDNSVKVRVGSL